MPHDKNGQLLQKGDRVTMIGTVQEVWPGEGACNVQVEFEEVEGEYAPSVICNSRFFEKVDEA